MIKNLLRKNIRELAPYSCARDEFSGVAEVFLDANENFKTYSSYDFNRYPDPHCTLLRKQLDKKLGLPFDNTVIGNGSDELIDNLIRSFCEPKQDKIIIMNPTYGAYKVFADINDVETVFVNYKKNFEIDFPLLEQTIENENNLKLLFICSPNNPTGRAEEIETIEKIIKIFKGIVIVDEAYAEFSDKESCVKLVQKYENLVVLKTLSKCFAAAGIRAGIMISNLEIVSVINNMKAPYNVSSSTQIEALKILDQTSKIYQQRDEVIERRKRYFEKFKSLNYVKKIYDSDANFLLMEVEDSTYLCKKLQDKKIIIRNRTKDLYLKNCVRITIGSEEECLAVFDAIKGVENERK
ncbi:MAG: histidinol-phosphate transaminase [Pleomorphochaeta sp.]|nr:histidinol-phosphate transaminase [Sphaerochaetaceae bacterium]